MRWRGPPTEKEARRRRRSLALARGRAPARDDALIQAGSRGDPCAPALAPASVWGERRGGRERRGSGQLSSLSRPTNSLSPPPSASPLPLSLLSVRVVRPLTILPRQRQELLHDAPAARRGDRVRRAPERRGGAHMVWLDSPLSEELPPLLLSQSARALSIRQRARPLRRPPGRLCEWGRDPPRATRGGSRSRRTKGRRGEGSRAFGLRFLSYERGACLCDDDDRSRGEGSRSLYRCLCVCVCLCARAVAWLLLLDREEQRRRRRRRS